MRLVIAGLLALFSVSSYAADTHRSEAEMLTNQGQLFPLNNAREIGAQDLRDGIFSLLRNDEQRILRADSIADLRSLDLTSNTYVVQDDAIAFVSGYTAAGDHGGVHYRYDASCTDSDNAGLVLEPTTGAGCWRMIHDGEVDVRWFGAVTSTAAAEVDTTTAIQRAIDTGLKLILVGEEDSGGTQKFYNMTSAFKPQRGARAQGPFRTIIRAMTGFSGDFLMDLDDMVNPDRNLFAGFELNANSLAKYALGDSDCATNTTGHNIFERMDMGGAATDGYIIFFPDACPSTGSDGVGSTFTHIFLNGNSGNNAGLIRIGIGQDDMLFQNIRGNIGNDSEFPPILINQATNVTFHTMFMALFDFSASTFTGERALFDVNGCAQCTFSQFFFERNETIDDIDFFFHFDGQPNAIIENILITAPSSSWTGTAFALIDVSGGDLSTDLRIAGIDDNQTVFTNFIQYREQTGSTQIVPINIRGSGKFGYDTLEDLIAPHADNDTQSNTKPIIHLTGDMGATKGFTLDHHVIGTVASDSTQRFESTNPAAASYNELDLIAANTAVARFICPFDAYVQRVQTVLTAALATGDATLTAAITGAGNITGGVVTITQSGSAAGDVDSATPTAASNDNECDEGEEVTVTVGGSSTAGTGNVQVYFGTRAS